MPCIPPTPVYQTVLLIVSNVVGLFAAYRLFTYRFYTLAIVIGFSAVVSCFYHASDSICAEVAGITPTEWGTADFWLAFSSIISIAVLFTKWTSPYRHMQHAMLVFLMILMLLLILWDQTDLSSIFVITTVISSIVALKFAFVDGGWPSQFALMNFIVTMVIGAGGIALYAAAVSTAKSEYWWIHSLWHVVIYAAPFFAVDIYNPYRRFCFWRKHRADGKWCFRWRIHHPEDWFDTDYYGTPIVDFPIVVVPVTVGVAQDGAYCTSHVYTSPYGDELLQTRAGKQQVRIAVEKALQKEGRGGTVLPQDWR